ncbi:hypothetical protein F2P79_005159 [Pimephales promelas]|nr:hypothetical protein F2P79_005159 [Pimephales promelas]
MQEWEDQLQDMQRKIEELYNEVKARREASESSPSNVTNNKSLDITLLPVNSQYRHQANGYHEPHGHPNNNLPIRQSDENPKVYPVTHSYQDSMKTSLVTNRTASCVVLDEFEEAENHKNKKSTSWDDSPSPPC